MGECVRVMVWVIFLPLAMMASALQAKAQDRTQSRSMVISRRGVVSAENPLAAQAGATVLANGGNAVDAAVATNAVMGVVEPMMNGIGGDLFAIVYDAKSGKLYGLNASGWAPARLSVEFLKSKGIVKMPQAGIQSVTVPGAVDGWSKLLARFGTKKLVGRRGRSSEAGQECCGNLPARWSRAASGRNFPQSRSCAVA
jgi:gamma-glutamyltranspeptidase/glutathione hydrolase